MKTSITGTVGSIVGTIMMGFFLAAMINSIDVMPALGEEGHKDMRRHDDRDMRKHDNDRNRYEHRGAGYDRDMHGRRVYRPYGYAPPPVIYAPTPPRGIDIFFPPIFIHH